MTESLPVRDALDAESLAYSTLLGGAEFRRWHAARGPRPQPPTAPDPVLIARNGEILEVTLNRPARRNAYDRRTRDALVEALHLATLDDTISRVVLTGAGPAFCSGGDLNEFGTTPDAATAAGRRLQVGGFRDQARPGDSGGEPGPGRPRGERTLGDVRVRKAINMAFDRTKMVKQLLRGSGRPTEQIFNRKGSGHDAALDQTYSYASSAASRRSAPGRAVAPATFWMAMAIPESAAPATMSTGTKTKVRWVPFGFVRSTAASQLKRFGAGSRVRSRRLRTPTAVAPFPVGESGAMFAGGQRAAAALCRFLAARASPSVWE
ncbi:enoyl-CoA hydratase-related protein [Streptomyces sp. NPDC048275]|uniref:enoyl-CoA hydratase/isomerase family protein n=1 Tax=Streptomyces sp. NPDC048275 TaxID=3155629 RepID=UPI0033ED9DDA